MIEPLSRIWKEAFVETLRLMFVGRNGMMYTVDELWVYAIRETFHRAFGHYYRCCGKWWKNCSKCPENTKED